MKTKKPAPLKPVTIKIFPGLQQQMIAYVQHRIEQNKEREQRCMKSVQAALAEVAKYTAETERFKAAISFDEHLIKLLQP